ncbi:hypothetical protein BC829DRAFT_211090 [Chytridium lagenaria]|nr:hypothetical protein BC829DRAFT_211090 [Chytridium lagenaria]
MIVGLTDEDGHALNEEGLRFVDIRETEEEALQTELERKMLKGKQKDKPNASAVVENPNLGSFEREMLEKLAKYEEEGDDDEEEDEPANEEDDGDEDSENSDVPRNNSDSDIESEEEPVIAASTMKRAQLKPLIKPGTIKNPADIYKQMKALAGKESSEVIGEIEIGGGQKIAIKSEIPEERR